MRGLLAMPLLLLLLFPAQGCSDETPEKPLRIRWVDPRRIASFETDHPALLNGEEFLFSSDIPDHLLDAQSDWYPFIASVELEESIPVPAAAATELVLSGSRHSLRLDPDRGVACVVPVESGQRIRVSVCGNFSPSTEWEAAVTELWSVPEMPPQYTAGALKACIQHMGSAHPRALDRSAGEGTASLILDPKQGAKGLLVYVSVRKGEPGLLQSVAVTRLTPRHEFLIQRQAMQPGHPCIADAAFIDGTVMPSFLLPPRTKLCLNAFEVLPQARFCCSFAVEGERSWPLEVRLDAIDPKGAVQELFCHLIEPGETGWHALEHDLSFLSGKTMRFILESRWRDGMEAAVAAPPLVFCGAPQVYTPLQAGFETGRGLNLILISLDTLRQDRLGCYGYPRPVSPQIDQLAVGSLVFENAYAQAPYTLASHATLFSGLYPATHGARSERDRIPERIPLLSQVLARNGFATASFNGGSFVSHEFGFHRGFDLYCEVDPMCDRSFYGDSFTGIRFSDGSVDSFDRALKWLDRKKDEPFFLFLHTFMIHEYLPPAKWASEFNKGCKSRLEPGNEARHAFSLSRVLTHGISSEDLAFAENMYDATIRTADDRVGELIRHLEVSGLLDRTVLVITSDHGEEFMEHGSVKHMQTLYEELIRVPLIIRLPHQQGARIQAAVSHVDLMPTLLEWLGISCPESVQGRSFASFAGRAAQKDRPVYAEAFMPGRTERWCLISEEYKYIQGNTDAALRYPAAARHELFRLSDDPGEHQNVLKTNLDKGEALKKRLEQMRSGFEKAGETLRDRGMEVEGISNELLDLLREQGYL
ncbi:MAG: sulfatase [Planctomycetota bacterium]